MGRDIQGWIEVRKAGIEEQWDAVVNVGKLFQGARNYELDSYFFMGQANIVGCRGLPDKVSKEVADMELTTPPYICITYMNWADITQMDWSLITSCWQLMYDIMELLITEYGENRVRIIIWYI